MRKKSEPTIAPRCPVPGCDRQVGPYFTDEYAYRAMATHIRMRHNDIRPARTIVDGNDGWEAVWRGTGS